MSNHLLISIADICQSATVLLSLAAYIPQWHRIYRNRSSNDVSIHSWMLWLISSVLAWFYAFVMYSVYGTGAVLLVTASLSVCLITITTFIVYSYRTEPTDKDTVQQLAKENSSTLTRRPSRDTIVARQRWAILASGGQFDTIH